MKKYLFFLGIIGSTISVSAQCFSDVNGKRTEPVVSTFATYGKGKYKNEIIWLNWGASSASATNGASKTLEANDYSNAEIKINDNKFICVKTIVKSVNNLKSDVINRNYSIMHNTYSNAAHNMYHLLTTINSKTESKILLESYAFVRTRTTLGEPYTDVPFKIKGLIFADAESANNIEYFSLTANGDWNLVEFINETGNTTNNYNVTKNYSDNVGTITMGEGADQRMAGIAMLRFNDTAYSSLSDKYKVTYNGIFYGGGTTSISIGILTPFADFGDAPISYGAPIHFIDKLELVNDNLTLGEKTNVGKSTTFKSGALIRPNSNYIGSLGPDSNSKVVFSKYADGDNIFEDGFDNNGDPLTSEIASKEEDAWPDQYKGFSYKTVNGSNYPIGSTIDAKIPVKTNKASVLAGWIDFDLNGKFDQSERVYIEVPANTDESKNLIWRVPSVRKPFSTYARLRLFDLSDVSTNGAIDLNKISPTSDVYSGEVEDHYIKIYPQSVSNPMILNSTNTYSK